MTKTKTELDDLLGTAQSPFTIRPDDSTLYQWVPLIPPDLDAPCKHEWRQYMRSVERGDITGYAYHLAPIGFFCIHCTERRDDDA